MERSQVASQIMGVVSLFGGEKEPLRDERGESG